MHGRLRGTLAHGTRNGQVLSSVSAARQEKKTVASRAVDLSPRRHARYIRARLRPLPRAKGQANFQWLCLSSDRSVASFSMRRTSLGEVVASCSCGASPECGQIWLVQSPAAIARTSLRDDPGAGGDLQLASLLHAPAVNYTLRAPCTGKYTADYAVPNTPSELNGVLVYVFTLDLDTPSC